MSDARNTNAYLNALNQNHKNAVSKASEAAEKASREILKAHVIFTKMPDTMYNPAAEKNARNALQVASDASWNAMLAANQTYQKGNSAPPTQEKNAARRTHQLQTLMSNITTNMNAFMNPLHSKKKPGLKNTVHRKIIKATAEAGEVVKSWAQLNNKPSQEAGGKTRRNKKSRSRRH